MSRKRRFSDGAQRAGAAIKDVIAFGEQSPIVEFVNSLPLTIREPLFGVTTNEPCWKCEKPQRVIALGCL